MRSFAAVALYLVASCGGGQRAASEPPVAATPGPVTRPEPTTEVGPVPVVMASSPAPADDSEPMPAPAGPRFSDEPLPAVTPQPPAKGCRTDELVAEGKDRIAMGMHAKALSLFEKALVCVHDPEIEKLAVLAACQGRLYQRARAHFIRLAEKDKPAMAQVCQGPMF